MTHCAHPLCNAAFEPVRVTQVYCSKACRRAAREWMADRGAVVIFTALRGGDTYGLLYKATKEYTDARNSALQTPSQSGKKIGPGECNPPGPHSAEGDAAP